MGIKDRIKTYVKPNLMLYSSILEVRSKIFPNTRKLNSFIDEITNVDSIEEYDKFCDMMAKVKHNPEITMPRFNRYGNEASYYGYYNEIVKYAGAKEGNVILLPEFEHGIRFGSSLWRDGDLSGYLSCACQGPGRIQEAHDYNPWLPVFVLGPYIHYASSYYSSEQITEMKDKYGRILLVFPSHTCEENIPGSDAETLFKIVFEKYAKDYDTIFVCSYWNDIESPILDEYRKNGAKLVSAGFRNDQNFIRRLKAIISLSDCVVVDDLGTNIGMSIYMGKTVYFESAVPRMPNDSMYVDNFNQFRNAFHSDDNTFSDAQMEEQKRLYEFFWGGDKYTRSPEEIRDILEVMQEMLKETHYSLKKMPEFIKANCSGDNIENRYRLLAQAVDPSVWDI